MQGRFGDDPSLPRPAGYETRWRGLIFIGISLLVISLDNTILNVALPAISRTLGATISDLQWITDAYILVFAALLLTMGSFSDRIGRKRALQIGLALFGLGSLAAALSNTTAMLIASRAFLGIGGAMIMPSTLSIISATFPAYERPQAIALWASVFALGVGIGPVMGGLLVQTFSWNAVFLVNLPVVTVAIIGGAIYLGESRDETAPKADIPGVILSIVGLFALIYGIIEAGIVGWTAPNVLIAFAVAAVFIGAFAWWENRTPNAMLPMHFFKNRTFTSSNITLTLLTFSMFGSFFFLSQYFQTVQAVPSFEAGLRILPQAIALTVVSSQSAKVAGRLGVKRAIAVGVLIAAIGLFYLSRMLHVDTPYWIIMIGQITLASGIGIAISPATAAIMGSVPMAKAGIGSAMNDTTRQLGGALGVAVLGTVATNAYLSGIEPLREALASAPPQLMGAITSSIQAAHAAALNAELPAELQSLILTTTNEAFVTGMNNAMLVGALTMVVSFLVVLVLMPLQPRHAGVDPHGEPAPEAIPAGD